MEIQLFEHFLKNEGTWAILFLFLFLYVLKMTKDRYEEQNRKLEEFRKKLEEDIKLIHANTTFITTTWKVVLEKEIKRRRKE